MTAKVSPVFELTTDTGFVSAGRMDKHMRSKLSTITRKAKEDSDLLPLVTPGEYLVEEFLEPLGITANALSLALRVPANRIQAIVKGQRSITADTALRLAQYFGTTADFWINLQSAYDLDKARREKLAEIRAQVMRRPVAQEQPRSKSRRRSGY